MEDLLVGFFSIAIVTLVMTTIIIGFGLAVGIGCAIPAVLFSLPILAVKDKRKPREQE